MVFRKSFNFIGFLSPLETRKEPGTGKHNEHSNVEQDDHPMTRSEADVVLHRLVLPSVEVGGDQADGEAGEAGEEKVETKHSADLLPACCWKEVREEEV